MARDHAKTSQTSTRTARTLRRQQIDAERRLWWALRGRQLSGVKFRRQQPIGSYVVDFCALDRKLVIEVDGGQHMERAVEDAHRSSYLQRCAYAVLRFWNDDVLQRTEAVLEQIEQEIERTRQRQR
jgi:very-short-patch-repair endonuclease